jgi:hypothetical protein
VNVVAEAFSCRNGTSTTTAASAATRKVFIPNPLCPRLTVRFLSL